MADQNSFLIYQDDNGVSNVNVRFEGEDVWLAAEQIQVLFQASRQDVAYHIEQIYADGELKQEATCKKFLQVRQARGNLQKIFASSPGGLKECKAQFRTLQPRHDLGDRHANQKRCRRALSPVGDTSSPRVCGQGVHIG